MELLLTGLNAFLCFPQDRLINVFQIYRNILMPNKATFCFISLLPINFKMIILLEEDSEFLAKLIEPYCLSVACLFLTRRQRYPAHFRGSGLRNTQHTQPLSFPPPCIFLIKFILSQENLGDKLLLISHYFHT